MAVRKRGNKWEYIIESGQDPATGKRRQLRKSGFPTKKAADEAEREVRARLQRGEPAEQSKVSLGEYLEGWIERRRGQLKKSTFGRYRRDLRLYLIPHLGAIPLGELRAQHLDDLYAKLLREGRPGGDGPLSRRTVQHMAMVLHNALGDAVRQDLLFRNVASQATPPKRERKEQKTWSEADVRTFLDRTKDHPDHAMFRLALSTGMRQGEILGLRWKDIDFERRRISVCQALSKSDDGIELTQPKTARGRRSIPFGVDLGAALERHRRTQTARQVEGIVNGVTFQDHDLVFPGRGGGPIYPSWIHQKFQDAVKTAGVPRIRFHDMRHTYATIALQAGVNAKTVADILGHESVAFTLSTYAHAVPQLEEDAAARLEALFGATDVDSASDMSDEPCAGGHYGS